MSEIESFERPLNGLQKVIDLHLPAGMEILARDGLGHPNAVRNDLSLDPHHFVATGFMASCNPDPKCLPGTAALVYLFAKTLAEISLKYDANISLLSGGGRPADNKHGLMCEWARAVVDSGMLARFVTMQKLVEWEGLPLSNGKAVCLKHFDGEERIGERGDGLHCAGELFISFPGGLGTGLENHTIWTNISIYREDYWKKAIFVDPIIFDPDTGKPLMNKATGNPLRSMDYIVADLELRAKYLKTITPETAREINTSCFIYQPCEVLHRPEEASPVQMCRELISLTLAIRNAAPTYAPHAGYEPLSTELISSHIEPFMDADGQGSKVVPIFPSIPTQWNWIEDLKCLRKPRSETRLSPFPPYEKR